MTVDPLIKETGCNSGMGRIYRKAEGRERTE
jgi:hypothetical protein